MTNISILLIDDEEMQVNNLKKAIEKSDLENYSVFGASKEEEILRKVEYCYYDIAVVDLRMNGYKFNGFSIIEQIKSVSPNTKIIVVSAYGKEYQDDLNKVLSLGSVIGFVDKEDFAIFSNNIITLLKKQQEKLGVNNNLISQSLRKFYAELKNEKDAFKKGQAFEFFMTMLFSQMGFRTILERVRDRTPNEIDLAIRNDIEDPFFSKFAPYVFVECKNYAKQPVDKNAFIVFKEKVENSNGLASLGVLVTTGRMTGATYNEAVRTSNKKMKIIFLSNPEIEELIDAENKLEKFKIIIDNQVKDN